MQKKSAFLGAARTWLLDKENRICALCALRYLFPLLWALSLGVLGFFYNIRAGQLRLSLWHLLFNTVKQSRKTLLAGNAAGAVRSYCILLLVGCGVAVLALLAALIFAVIALYTFTVATGKRSDDGERREAKILFRAVFRGRVSLFIANLLLLLPALFPLYFSIVSNRHPGGGFISLGFDPVLTVSLVLAGLLAFLCLYLSKKERHKHFDMFYIAPEEDDADEVGDNTENLPE